MDFKEKRLGIIFKVLYVITAFLATLLLTIGKQFYTSISTTYIIISGITTALLILLRALLAYIINELKTLTPNIEDNEQIQKTETSYNNIFAVAEFLPCAIFIITITLCLLQNLLYKRLALTINILGLIGCILLHYTRKKFKLNHHFFVKLNLIIQTITIEAIFLHLAFL